MYMLESNFWWYRVLHELVAFTISKHQKTSDLNLLDDGCGRGRHALYFTRHRMNVTACDLSEDGIEIARTLANKADLTIRFDRADFRLLPYNSGSMDCVIAYHIIYHSYGPGTQKALDEIKRVLRPGGEAFVTFLSVEGDSFKDPGYERVDAYTIRKTKGFETGIPHHYVDRERVLQLLQSWDIITLRHVEEIYGTSTSAHYFTLIRKPK